jgi:hypothetical protein
MTSCQRAKGGQIFRAKGELVSSLESEGKASFKFSERRDGDFSV